MPRSMSRILSAAIAALGFAVAFPETSFATSDAGMWKVSPAQSKINPSGPTRGQVLTVERKGTAQASQASTDSKVVVVNKNNVYLTNTITAKYMLAGKRVSPASLTLIGTNVRSYDNCGMRCQTGYSERLRRFTFTAIGGQPARLGRVDGEWIVLAADER